MPPDPIAPKPRPRTHPVHPLDVFGLRPLGPGLRQCRTALLGDGRAPPSKWGPSGLRILMPRVAVPMWLGRARRDRRVVITQLPNRAPPPHGSAYSVRSTFAWDFRGRRLSYDSHVGTDLAIPPGTAVVAPADGVVRMVERRLQRGGLKVGLDHGGGLATTLGHLARALVEPGQRVARGQVVGLSGMSGLDGILFCPWLAPHVHFNVLRDGVAVDPFAAAGEVATWRTGNHPEPHRGGPAPTLAPTRWDPAAVAETVAMCLDPAEAERLRGVADPQQRAFEVMFRRLFEPFLFPEVLPLTRDPGPARPVLDLPFAERDYDGVVYADEP